MRINQFIAHSTDYSRRKADLLVAQGRITINDVRAYAHSHVLTSDVVKLDNKVIAPKLSNRVLLLNKPVGYVCTHAAFRHQSNIFELLPQEFRNFKIAGRLDKNSQGLVLLTNNGDLLNQLTHPSNNKIKSYEVKLNRSLTTQEIQTITSQGVDIGDVRLSKFSITSTDRDSYLCTLHEGRNRQIRRTFRAINAIVTDLRRITLDKYSIEGIKLGEYKTVDL